ncbi:MAG: PD-(D/E)XK nuclease domain-containing protein, partial [Endomicrobium sp.]|nr:PD-(D/E)XK nuclease domain-containing protein [Endomicrobium sp.]
SEDIETTALLFQTGYLTIKKEEIIEDESEYTIDFPNKEVKSAFLGDLLEAYTNKELDLAVGLSKNIAKSIVGKEAEKLKEELRELYATIAYNLHIRKEAYYHSLFLVTCRLTGFEVESEVHTDKGRIDVVLKKGSTVVIVEIKYSKDNKPEEMLKEAMRQIRDNKYYQKYKNNNPTLLGIVFSENKDIACRFEYV